MDERVIVITGASSGIGAALAMRLAGRHHGLVLHARASYEALDEVADRVRGVNQRRTSTPLSTHTNPLQLHAKSILGWGHD